MSDIRVAAEQALVALKLANDALIGVIAWDESRDFIVPYKVRDPIHAAITAIMALAQIAGRDGASAAPILTDAQITQIIEHADGSEFSDYEFARAIEAAALLAHSALTTPGVPSASPVSSLPASDDSALPQRFGLVERLRNGGQVDLADMAEGLLLALKEMVAMAENFDVDGKRQDAAFKQAEAAIDAAMKG